MLVRLLQAVPRRRERRSLRHSSAREHPVGSIVAPVGVAAAPHREHRTALSLLDIVGCVVLERIVPQHWRRWWCPSRSCGVAAIAAELQPEQSAAESSQQFEHECQCARNSNELRLELLSAIAAVFVSAARVAAQYERAASNDESHACTVRDDSVS